VRDQREIESAGRRILPWRDDEGAVEPLSHLVRRGLVGVVPERPDLVRAEAIGVAVAWRHGVLRDAGDAVLRVRDVHAVPVHRNAFFDVAVDERHLDEVALAHS
jgi:hypothetical protein